MRERKWKKQLLASVLAISLALPSSVLASEVQENGTVIDTEGPSYEGTVIMAENMGMPIGSDEELKATQNVGLDSMGGPLGREKMDSAEWDTEEGQKVRCGVPFMQHEELPSLAALPSVQNASGKEKVYELGERKTIYSEYALSGEKEIEVELAAAGDTCTIWRSVNERELLPDEQAQAYADILDDQLYDVMKETFGDWSAADVDQDGKTAFVFYSIPYAGFFETTDLYTKEETEYASGNHMDMLHIDISTTDQDVTLGVLVHELQHLINWAQAGEDFDIWLNEVFSQSAIAVTGLSNSDTVYETEWTTAWIEKNGYSFPFIYEGYYVPSGDTLGMPYGSWYLFGRYLSHQTEELAGGGDSIFKTILEQWMTLSEGESSLDAIEKALQVVGYLGDGKAAATIEDVITNYNIALYLRESSGIYALGNNPENPNEVDKVEIAPIYAVDTAPESIPGGGAACWVYNRNTGVPVTPSGFGNDMKYAGIDKTFLEGVFTDPLPSLLTFGQEISLYTMDTDAKIYYTTDGSNPLTDGTEYTEPVPVQGPMVLSACSINNEGDYSLTSSWEINNVKVPSVKADVASGIVEPGTQITLSCDADGAAIIYTTDGSSPSAENGEVYEKPLEIEHTTTIKAAAYFPDREDLLISNVKTFVYETSDLSGDRYEPNDTLKDAVSLSFPGKISGTLHQREDVDYYSFTLDNGAALSLTLTPPSGMDYSLTLLDEQGQMLKTSALEGKSQSIRYEAKSGRYFVKIESIGKQDASSNPYELSLMKEMDSEAINSLDFSEKNMLTALTDKSSGYAYDLGLNGGGHFLMSMTYFANWGGPVSESDDPYPAAGSEFAPDTDYSYKNLSNKAQYHVTNALYMPDGFSEENISHIKNAIYNYGAVDVYILSAHSYMTSDQKNVYVGDYKYATPYDGGHIVTIVGWDDNYSKDNFTGNEELAELFYGEGNVQISKPEHDGAFIVKNSWGEQSGENGYFYISYEDSFLHNNNPAVFLTDEAADNYNHQYYYDILGATDMISGGSSFTVEQKFENTTDTAELLRAVSFQILSSNVRYEVSITCEGSAKKVLEGVKNYAGFYTERLSDPVLIPAGSEFSVSIYLESLNDGQDPGIGISCDISGTTSGLLPIEGVSFLEANGEWTDIGAQACFPCVRAYTCNVDMDDYETTAPELSTDKSNLVPETSLPETISVGGVEIQNSDAGLNVTIDAANGALAPSVEELPECFDLRETGTLTPVRNQGSIGSCWTFAAMASAENTLARSGGFAEDYPTSLSLDCYEQQVLLTKDNPEQTLTLSAELVGAQNPASGKIYWSVSGDVDSVRMEQSESFSGKPVQVLTALKPGIVTVTAQSDADMTVTAQCTVNITKQGVESITLDPAEITLKKGETTQIKASTAPENAMDDEILWTSSKPEIASVDENGTVTAISGGTAVITAKAGTAEATSVITVEGNKAVNPGADKGQNTGNILKSNGTIHTGDSSHILPVLLVLLISAGTAAGCLIWRKKRQH